jgi:hypothetical protein
MEQLDVKAQLHRYLQMGRDGLLWKLDGLSEYDLRRPLVPTGTNLLGIVKHLTGVERGYLADTFGRPLDGPLSLDWDDPLGDMWATVDERSEDLIGAYRRTCSHADETIESLPLDALGRVPWWPEERAEVTLHHILIRVATETHRHLGHADIVREMIDGGIGYLPGNTNLPDGAGVSDFADHLARVQEAAEAWRSD